MKKLILPMLITAFALSLTSCKKDKKETDNSQATVAKLQGKWEATKLIKKIYEVQSNNLVSENTTTYPANERSIEYKGSEILYYRNQTLTNTYTYALIDNGIRIREGNEGLYFQLKFYSDTQHSHIEEFSYKSNTNEIKEITETIYIKK